MARKKRVSGDLLPNMDAIADTIFAEEMVRANPGPGAFERDNPTPRQATLLDELDALDLLDPEQRDTWTRRQALAQQVAEADVGIDKWIAAQGDFEASATDTIVKAASTRWGARRRGKSSGARPCSPRDAGDPEHRPYPMCRCVE